MPRLAINYENACIYEIVCKDVSITQRYIGSTTNLIKRRYEHKSDCNNEKRKNYNYYVYQFIRDNGGIANWDIVLIEKVIDCKDKENLHKRERFYIEEKKAELNKCIPLRTKKERYEENKEVIAEYHKEYNINNKNKIAEYSKKRYVNDKDKIAERKKEWCEKNMEKYKEYQKAYHANNKNKKAERNKDYYQNNKDKINERQRIYRANKK